jgi:RND family efflux transporter MFP subunit
LNPYLLAPVCFVVLVGFGAAPRLERQVELNQVHHQLAVEIPEVKAAIVKPAENTSKLVLPGDMQAIQDIPIYARANGYVHQRYVDIGDNVKAGQLLATIETPELDQQVEQAKANLQVAEANLDSAEADRQTNVSQLRAAEAAIRQAKTNLDYSRIENIRYHKLADEGAVSYEDGDRALKLYNSDTEALKIAEQNEKAAQTQLESTDNKVAANKRSVEANRANLKQYQALQAFHNIIAPSDGVITARFIDPGSLVALGGGSGSTQLLTMARTDVLRIYVDVPQSDYRYIHNGDKAEVLLQEFPDKVFTGTVTNIAGALNSGSRTLQTEIRIQNQNHVLKPGAYADVRFSFNRPDPPLVVPSNAVITKNDGIYVALATDGKVHYQKIEAARDYGSKMEVSSGLKDNDVVLLDAPDNLVDGAAVRPVLIHS